MYIVSTLESFDRQEKPATFLCPVFVCGVLVFEFESSDATPFKLQESGFPRTLHHRQYRFRNHDSSKLKVYSSYTIHAN